MSEKEKEIFLILAGWCRVGDSWHSDELGEYISDYEFSLDEAVTIQTDPVVCRMVAILIHDQYHS
jgi:hypothetical protein